MAEDRERSPHYQLGRLAMAARLHLRLNTPHTAAELKRLVDEQLEPPIQPRGVADGLMDAAHDHLEDRRRELCRITDRPYRYEPRD